MQGTLRQAQLDEKLAAAYDAIAQEPTHRGDYDRMPTQVADLQRLLRLGKKPLAREIIRLQEVLERIKLEGLALGGTATGLRHREAFAIMIYANDNGEEVTVWNGRDGVTPFAFMLDDGERYEHVLSRMVGPSFEQPEQAQYRFETLRPEQALACYHRHLDRIIANEAKRSELLDRPINPELGAKIKELRACGTYPTDNGYEIGLRNLVTGKLVGELT